MAAKKHKTSPSRKHSHLYFLPFYLSVFLSAFLLFQVQPIISKYILPWFGGGFSVWTTAILFFEVLLLFGYLYSHFLTTARLKKQIIVHALLGGLVLLTIFTLFFTWDSPITPPLRLKLDDTFLPVIQVLAILLLAVGLPYFLLSTTSSLLQRWFSHTSFGRSPYSLYSLSNAGSLLGIVTYPFFVEVLLPLRTQGQVWSVGFVLYGVLLGICGIMTLRFATRTAHENPEETITESYREVDGKRILLWLFLPALSSLILLSTTSHITQSVAPVPFLWLLPLSLYLLSFILCFSNKPFYWRNFYSYLVIALAVAVTILSLDLQSITTNFIVYTVFIFSSFMLLHGELYIIKPEPKHLTLYYLLIAFGGAIGGVIVVIIAPVVFTDYWEYFAGIFLAIGVAVSVLILHRKSIPYWILSKVAFLKLPKSALAISIALCVICVIAGFVFILSDQTPAIAKFRNFYGTVSVYSDTDEHGEYLGLYNGRISHGTQYTGDDLKKMPITYYSEESGVGLAIKFHPKRATLDRDEPLRIGVTGLGVGTIAAYGNGGDTITFYEINPAVIDAANNYFTYLADSGAKIAVISGDARVSMEKQLEQDGKPIYDALILDAFVDDAIPVHLLTKEAFDVYLKLLEPKEGILAVHISNRYLDLEPVIARLAEQYGLGYAVIESDDDAYNIASATWVLLSSNEKFIKNPVVEKASSPQEIDLQKIQLWTDDYSNLFQVLDI